jgi:two-component system chemotaxis sensor kinase CheA
MLGASNVPARYTKSVDSMLNHLVRNAVEHGIENPELRVSAGKRATGTITVECADLDTGGIELIVQDDGAGFDVERIARIAVETGLLTSESLTRTDPRALIGLIFRPGFSTAGVAGCNGRGLGMEFLRELVTRLNGNITVATKSRQYTRFRIVLPAAESKQTLTSQQRVA